MNRNLRLLVVTVLVASSTAVFSAEAEPKAKFVKPSEKVREHKVVLEVEVGQDVLDKADVWVGVVPVNAPDTIWIQGAGVQTPKSQEVVFLGREGNSGDAGKYQVRIVSFPKDAVKGDGPIKVSIAKKLGMRVLASCIIERVE